MASSRRLCRLFIHRWMIDALREDRRFLCGSCFIIIDFQAQHQGIMLIGSEGIHPGGKAPGNLLVPGVFVDAFAELGLTDWAISLQHRYHSVG